MAKISLNGVEVEVEDGAPLVEAIKKSGVWISNLCYIDGLPPYAGCRSCLVEIEGARGLQLSCTSRVTDGMVVRTDSTVVTEARQAVISIINANHSDRCLTCHRRIHCMPGDICLRDSVVTHRCLTCAKNYRCELQRTNEMADMANYEPWVGEDRTYYMSAQPEADRANPWLEFDPQMCIICTRCVRACDEIRHTGAITLAGRGASTRIAFGAGGAIHDSSCDFCGACIDVCPTATLLEKPNKWIARSEEWISTACNSCSIGCTLTMAVRNGRVVMVKPERMNPVSDQQICVRGRFHYDAIKPRERLTRHLVRRDGVQLPTPFAAAVDAAAEGLAAVVQAHGPASVGVMVGPWATNEEAHVARLFANEVIGSERLGSTAAPVALAVRDGLTEAFGTDVLPADLSRLAKASTVLVLADDLESSHNIAALRAKDAVVYNGASLVVVTPRWGELCDFIEPPPAGSIMPSPQRPPTARGERGVWLAPPVGGEIATIAALTRLLSAAVTPAGVEGFDVAASGPTEVPGVEPEDLVRAAAVLQRAAAAGGEGLAIIYAPNPASPKDAARATRAVANLALVCAGQRAPERLYVLPTEVNVNGLSDMGVLTDASLDGARALIVVGDDPAMFSRGRDEIRAALEALDCLVVLDSVGSETAKRAEVVFADLPTYGKEGTFTQADRRVVRRARAEGPTGDQRDALEVLSSLGAALAQRLGKTVSLPATAREAMQQISASVPGYEQARFDRLQSGRTRALPTSPTRFRLQPVELPALPATNGRLVLTTSRTLYTSLEGAAILSPEADKLHREECVEINPSDAVALRLTKGEEVVVQNGSHAVTATVNVSEAIPAGSAFIPLYYAGGLVNTLLSADEDGPTLVTLRRA